MPDLEPGDLVRYVRHPIYTTDTNPVHGFGSLGRVVRIDPTLWGGAPIIEWIKLTATMCPGASSPSDFEKA